MVNPDVFQILLDGLSALALDAIENTFGLSRSLRFEVDHLTFPTLMSMECPLVDMALYNRDPFSRRMSICVIGFDTSVRAKRGPGEC
jgi:hypothetical protein